jgi:hypothetical protein
MIGVTGIALLVSAIALIVSALALYVASLKRAEIWVLEVPGVAPIISPRQWGGNGESTTVEVRFALAMFNVGARAGVLIAIRVPTVAADPFSVVYSTLIPNFMGGELRSQAVPAGGSATYALDVGIELAASVTSEILEQSRTRPFDVPIEWDYVRGRSAWRRKPLPSRGGLTVEVPLADFGPLMRERRGRE